MSAGPDSKAIAKREPEPSGLMPRSFKEIDDIAEKIAATGFGGVRSAEEAFVRVLAGVSLGLGPIQALMAINVIKGKPSLSAMAMLALVRASPLCERFEIIESTKERCVVETRRRRSSRAQQSIWTMQRAHEAGLVRSGEKGDSPWVTYPQIMLRWRAISELARQEYPEITLGIYTPEEAASIGPADAEGQVIDVIAREIQAEVVAERPAQAPAAPAPASEPTKASREEAYAELLRRIGEATKVLGKEEAARLAGRPIKGAKRSELEVIAERLELEIADRKRIEAEEAAQARAEETPWQRPKTVEIDAAAVAVVREGRETEAAAERERGQLQGREPGSEG